MLIQLYSIWSEVANLLKTITSPAAVLMGYWMLVSQNTTLFQGIWKAPPNRPYFRIKINQSIHLNWMMNNLDKDKFQNKE